MSIKSDHWDSFADKVKTHINEYTVKQYGDHGEDLASEYTPEQCIAQIKKYVARFGKNAREGQNELDLLKIAHYAQMASYRKE